MALIGDVGGFNSAMILIPNLLMSYFSFAMYKWAITEEMPVKKTQKMKKRNSMLTKLASNDHYEQHILS